MYAVCPPELAIGPGDMCVVERDRVPEYGQVVRVEEAPEPPAADRKEMGKAVRRATLQDQAKARENGLLRKMAAERCAAAAQKHNLKVRIVRVRYSFDRSVLHMLLMSEEHVDVRPLINDVSAELRTRVEARQIGVRDEAAILGGVGPCGRALCCATWLRKFDSINVRMAKSQRLSLNPAAISGMCGRLKCCLKYEYDTYVSLDRWLPREGMAVRCKGGKGCVTDKDILGQRIRVRLEDGRVVDCAPDEIEAVWADQAASPRAAAEPPGEATAGGDKG
jgi:cell fate regulator YaaT (PSP1 superfamily)